MTFVVPMILLSLAPAGQADGAEGGTQTPKTPLVETRLANAVRAEIRAPRTLLPVGGEVIVEFVIQNITPDPVVLKVPDALTGKESLLQGMGLPLEHVFSGVRFRGLEIATEGNPMVGERVVRKPEYPVPPLTLAPFGTVGLRFDVARFYPGLHQTGTYQLKWRPYGGAIESNDLTLQVVEFKQAVMETEHGRVTMRLLYEQAPRHVENFLDLVRQRFYNDRTFHIVYPGQFILGGCPEGDGTGRRPDGACLAPEFNDAPFDFGTVGMALIESDPNSASCQFFICLARQSAWDGRYTAFAQVEGPESMEVLRKLGAVAVDEQRRPTAPLKIKSITAIDEPAMLRLTR